MYCLNRETLGWFVFVEDYPPGFILLCISYVLVWYDWSLVGSFVHPSVDGSLSECDEVMGGILAL